MDVEAKLEALGLEVPDLERDYRLSTSGARYVSHLAVGNLLFLSGTVPLEYLYSRLLPGYGFPVGLDIADKHAHIPNWLTEAYGKLIRHHLGVSLQRGEISDAEMRNILVQAIYMTHRDWLYRPEV